MTADPVSRVYQRRPLGSRFGGPGSGQHTGSGRLWGETTQRSVELTPKGARAALEQSLERIAHSWDAPR
jgi:hypothetical protein